MDVYDSPTVYQSMTDGVPAIVARIKEFGQSHGIDFESEILAYDYKRRGVISTVSLHRWIGSMGISLSNRNVQTLITGYSKDDGVDALRLIADLKQSQTFTQTVSSNPANCNAELAELVRELSARRQTLREVLAPYDRRNSGRVTPTNFYRAFGATPTTRTIANAYAIGDEVDYTRLGNELKGVQRTIRVTTTELPAPTPGFAALATLIKTRGIDARSIFSQKDPLNTGKISKGQFQAILSFLDSKLTPNTVQEIARPFQADEHDVNYFLFLEAVDAFVPPTPRGREPSPEDVAKLAQLQDPNFLLQKAKETIESRRIDVDVHFSALAREGLGDEVSLARFARVILGLRVDLRPEEIEVVANLFKTGSGLIRYKDFVAAVRPQIPTQEVTAGDVVSRLKSFLTSSFLTLAQSAARFDREQSGVISGQQFASALQFIKFPFSTQDLAALRDGYPGPARGTINWKLLCREVDPPAPSVDAPAPISVSAVRPLPPESLADLVSKISSSATFQGIDLAAEFRALDPRGTDAISQDAFVQVLKKLPLQLTVNEVRPLVAFYRVSGSYGVSYLNFLKDAATIASKPAPAPTQLPVQTQTLPTLSPEVHGIIKRFKAFCEQRLLSPVDIFLPYDLPATGSVSSASGKVNTGFLASARLRAAFNNVQFELRDSEVDALLKAFKDNRRPDFFNYAAFTKAVRVEDITTPETRASLASPPVSYAVEQAAKQTAGQIREKLLARHRKIDIAFTGVTEDTIPAEEFQSRLVGIQLILKSGQIQALIQKYRVNLTGQIDWKTFVADVNQSKTVGE
jgi:Ca2+-binding EF-hand superfamily protein